MTMHTMYMIVAIMAAMTLIAISGTVHIYKKAMLQRKLVEQLQRQISCSDAELKAHVNTINLFEWFIHDLIQNKDDTLTTQFKLNNLAAAMTIIDMKDSMEGRYNRIHEILTSTCPEDIVEDMRQLLSRYYAYDPDTRDCVRLMVYTAQNAYDDFNGMDERRKKVFRQFLRELEYEGIRVNQDVKLRGRFSGNEPVAIDPVAKTPTLWEIKEEIDRLVESGAINLAENGEKNNEVQQTPKQESERVQTVEAGPEVPASNVHGTTDVAAETEVVELKKEVTPDNIGITTVVEKVTATA